MQIPSVGINIAVQKAATKADCDFPPEHGAWILCGGSEPGRGTNSYIFAHAQVGMFLPLWNVQLGAEVRVLMSDGRVLVYHVTEIHPNVNFHEFKWLQPTTDDRLTLQTCNGWRDEDPRFIVVAKRISEGTA